MPLKNQKEKIRASPWKMCFDFFLLIGGGVSCRSARPPRQSFVVPAAGQKHEPRTSYTEDTAIGAVGAGSPRRAPGTAALDRQRRRDHDGPNPRESVV